MRPQFVTDDHGKKLAVILPIKEYNKMVDDLEELEDIKLYDAAKEGEQEFTDAEEAFREIEKKTRTKTKMMYKVRVERKVQKKLSEIPEPYYSNLKTAILDLGNNPRP